MAASGGVLDFSDIRGALSEARRAFAIQRRVIFALILRETRTRYTDNALGFGWALIEPLIELCAMIVLFIVIKNRTAPIDVPLPVFLITGLFPFSLWRSSMERGATAHKTNAPLLSYPHVTVIDCIIARVLLDSATVILSMQIFIAVLVVLYGETFSDFYNEPLQVVLAFSTLVFLSMGSAILSSALTRLVPLWPLIFGLVSRLLWLFSGIFFTLNSLPSTIKRYAVYNPLAHMLDWIRSAMLSAYESNIYSVSYVLITAVTVMFVGLAAERMLRVIGTVERKTRP